MKVTVSLASGPTNNMEYCLSLGDALECLCIENEYSFVLNIFECVMNIFVFLCSSFKNAFTVFIAFIEVHFYGS